MSAPDRKRGDAILGVQGDQVWRLALKLTRILDQNDALGGLGHLGKKRVDKRCLAGRSPAGHENVAALRNGIAEDRRLLAGENARGRVVAKGENRDRRLANRECGRRDDRWDQALETFAGFRQLGRASATTRNEA
jgi:hypothetical protein